MLRKTKIILWVGVAIALFVILVVLLVMLRRPLSPAPERLAPRATPPPAQIRIDEMVGAILSGASPSKCREAGAREAVDRCFFVIATTRFDAELCDEIANTSERARCQGELVARRVAEGGDPEDCLTVADSDSRRSCILDALAAGAPSSFCNAWSGEEQLLCFDRVRLLAGLAGNASACEGIIDEGSREECFAGAQPREEPPPPPRVVDRDSDGDGLTDAEENREGTRTDRADTDGDGLSDFDELRTHDTDPTNSDSDGDGFSDGTEVGNGYNPNGPGRLP